MVSEGAEAAKLVHGEGYELDVVVVDSRNNGFGRCVVGGASIKLVYDALTVGHMGNLVLEVKGPVRSRREHRVNVGCRDDGDVDGEDFGSCRGNWACES